MSTALKPEQSPPTQYSYADYLRFPDDGKRWEIIDGVPYLMAAPRTAHQMVLWSISGAFYAHLRGKKCKAFIAPFDVRLPKQRKKQDKDIYNIVQPDITVYCDKKKYDDRGGIGAPEMVIEILSPSSGRMDRFHKFMLYREAGVREYWLVDPTNHFIEIYRLKNNELIKVGEYFPGDILPAPKIGCDDLADFTLSADQVFESVLGPGVAPIIPVEVYQ